MFLSKDEQPARRRSNPSYLCPRAPMMSRGGARGAPIKTGGPWGPHRKFEKKQNLHFSANFVFFSQSRGGPWGPKLNFYLHPIFYCFFIEYRQIISLVRMPRQKAPNQLELSIEKPPHLRSSAWLGATTTSGVTPAVI